MKIGLFKRKTRSEGIFDIFNISIMFIICFLTIYPIWYTLVNSFNNGLDAMKGGIYWFPRKISFDNYKAVFANTGILTALGITIAKTFIGTIIHVFFTALVAYSLSKRELIGRNLYILLGTITLFFSGGLIPNFLFQALATRRSIWLKGSTELLPSLT